ncbi:MAG: TspO/MBR family protein [Candidatus Woesearchaeota archaeon]
MVKNRWTSEALKILLFVIICLSAGFIGTIFTATGPDSWYSQIVKPSFNPPNWIFGPVWTTLYILMGISLYLAIKNKVGKNAIIIFAAQLILNTLWTIIFFGMQNPLLAFVEIILLWITILMTIILFYKKSKVAAYLMIPYILWVTFASVLTLSIHLLN